MKHREIFGCISKYGLGLFLFLVLSIMVVIVWLSAAPRDISAYAQSLLAQSVPSGSPYQLNVESMVLNWEDWQRPALVQLKQLKVTNRDNNRHITIEKARISLDLPSLLLGSLEIDELTVFDTTLSLWIEPSQVVILNAMGKEFVSIARQSTYQTIPALPFHELQLRNSKLQAYFAEQEVIFNAGEVSMDIVSDQWPDVSIDYQLVWKLAGEQMPMRGNALWNPKADKAALSMRFADVVPTVLCDKVISCQALPVMDVPVSGDVILTATASGKDMSIKATLEGQAGVIEYPKYFAEPFDISGFTLQVNLLNQFSAIELSQAEILFDGGTQLILKGDGRKEGEEGYRITIDASAQNMPVNDLYRFWPTHLAPKAREWTTTHIRDGIATQADATIRLIPSDLQKEDLPAEFLNAVIALDKTSVATLDELPSLTNVHGRVIFTGNSMQAELDKGAFLERTELKSGTIKLTDLNDTNLPVEVALSVASNPKDVASLIEAMPGLEIDKRYIQFDDAKGSVDTEISLGFDAYNPHMGKGNYQQVQYDIRGSFSAVSKAKAFDALNIGNIKGTFVLENQDKALSAKGTALGRAFEYEMTQTADTPKRWLLKTPLNQQALARFAPSAAGIIYGQPYLELRYQNLPITAKTIMGTVDFAQAGINWPQMGVVKPVGEPLHLSFHNDAAKNQQGPMRFQLSANGQEINSSGSMLVSGQFDQLLALQLQQLRYKQNDLSVIYRTLHDGFKLELAGDTLDLRPWLNEKQEDKKLLSGDFPSIRLKLDMKRLLLPENQQLQQVQGHVHCSSVRCESAEVKARSSDGAAHRLQIFRQAGRRNFLFESDALGSFARALNIHDRLYQGKAEIKGSYDDQKEHHPLSGRAIVLDFVIKDAPIMGKILNLSSLTGLMGNLRGEGIAFEKFGSDFVYRNQLLSLKDAKASGSSLGIIGNGDINVRTNRLDIEGNLAPAHVINSLVGKIPLLGQALVGGEGESVIAMNFVVKGELENPAITVNPLSMLTPGFTRRFFDIFDSPPDTEDPQTKEIPSSDNEPIQTMPKVNTRVIGVESQDLPAPE